MIETELEMRGLLALLMLAGWALPLAAGEPVRVGVVVLNGGDRVAEAAQAGMRVEAARILDMDGVRFEWRGAEGVGPGVEFDRLVVVRFTGDGVKGIPLRGAEGALGSTHVSDGRILPFVTIDAARVRRTVERAALCRRTGATDQDLGRALGRVLAHELYHVLSACQEHDREGVAKAALSGDELVGGKPGLGAVARGRMIEALRRDE